MSLTEWLRGPEEAPPPQQGALPEKSTKKHTIELDVPVNDGDAPASIIIALQADDVVEGLRREMEAHPLWECRLLRACKAGHLTLADWQFVFGQYQGYTTSFTRYIAAAMSGCPDDFFRARLAQNLWEEGGMLRPEQRHAQIFRDFLAKGLKLDPLSVVLEPYTEFFVDQYLEHCRSASPAFV